METNEQTINTDIIKACLKGKIKKKTTELNITDKCVGTVDLAIIVSLGYDNIKRIIFGEGTISKLINIPASVISISAANNNIDSINDFPESIETIILENNNLSGKLNLSNYIYVKHLNVAGNQLTEIIELPKLIQYLNITQNLIGELYLTNCIILSTLYCEYNPNLIVYNSPDSIVDSKYPPNIIFRTELNYNESEDKSSRYEDHSRQDMTEYKEKLENYFRLHKHYMDAVKRNKILAAESKNKTTYALPLCINCQKPGMRFSGLNNKYTASCGADIPCNWKLVIHRGKYHYFRDVLNEAISELEQVKEKIIIQKMDTLFGYISDAKSAELFEKHVEFYKSSTEIVNKYLTLYMKYYSNPHNNEIIQQKQKKIQQLLVTINEQLGNRQLEDAVTTQVTEIMPLKKFIQKLNYEYMAIESESGIIYLHEDQVSIDKQEINLGERPNQTETI